MVISFTHCNEYNCNEYISMLLIFVFLKAYILLTEITYLDLGLKKVHILDVPSHSSVRDKVMGKKWIYLKRNTLHRQIVNHLRR